MTLPKERFYYATNHDQDGDLGVADSLAQARELGKDMLSKTTLDGEVRVYELVMILRKTTVIQIDTDSKGQAVLSQFDRDQAAGGLEADKIRPGPLI